MEFLMRKALLVVTIEAAERALVERLVLPDVADASLATAVV